MEQTHSGLKALCVQQKNRMFNATRIKEGKLLLRNGKVINCCCSTELIITYDWAGTNLYDLDTSTRATWAVSGGESHGFSCANQQIYMTWTTSDNTDINGKESITVKIDQSRSNEEWVNPASLNIDLYAWWYPTFESGSGTILITAEFQGNTVTKNVFISARRTEDDLDNCAPNFVSTLTVSENGELSLS